MQVQNNYTFELTVNQRQIDYLEQLFFATRNTYNDLLRRFTSDYTTTVETLPLERASVQTLTKELEVLQKKPEYRHTNLAPKAVLLQKVAQLSEALTTVLVEDGLGKAMPLADEERYTPHSCVFPSESFFVRANLLYVPGIELPFELGTQATSNMYPLKVTIFRKDVGEYYAELLCAVSGVESVENLSF